MLSFLMSQFVLTGKILTLTLTLTLVGVLTGKRFEVVNIAKVEVSLTIHALPFTPYHSRLTINADPGPEHHPDVRSLWVAFLAS